MSNFTVTLPSGELWTPLFVTGIDAEKCIGCGRCFKVCARNVLTLIGIDEDGNRIALDGDDDDDEYEKKVMSVSKQESCIGCEACARICPRKCYSHAPAQT
ncbi:MAG: ferredoxin nif-specific [Burkholderiaceae bacterium]|nr:ferredoxin nif-specific [Burkholderiaceae bacterium]